MNNHNSITAYCNPNNQKKFNSERAMIARDLLLKSNQSRLNLGRRLGINDIEVQRRLSDMKRDGEVQVTGSRKHGENTISLYSLTSQLSMFPDKKLTLRQYFSKEAPDLLHKFDALYKHQL